ncbi:MAG: aminoacyl-tRNA deacylase [Candidatus Rariloculaceae bacterium]
MSIATTVGDALAFEELDFQILRHSRASEPKAAARAEVAPERLAKAVLLKDAHGYLLTVVPATRRPDLEVLRSALHRQLTIAEDQDLDDLFCDCVVGSVPPIGPWYRVPTVVDSSLKQQPDIYFEAGDDDSLVHVTETGFEQLLDGAEYFEFSTQV